MEKPSLVINSDVLLAGEVLLYNNVVRNGQGKISSVSNIGYVSLRDRNDSVVFTHKLKLQSGRGNGDFFLPSTLKTGVYKLISYTNLSRNNIEEPFFEKSVVVINPFITAVKSMDAEKEIFVGPTLDEIPNILDQNTRDISISAEKSVYGKREKVNVKIENLTEKHRGNYVLSVRKMYPVSVSDPVFSKKSSPNDLVYLPELRGELISGMVLSAKGGPVSNQVVSLTLPGESPVFKLAKTNGDGRFYFSVDEPYQEASATIKLDDKNLELNDLEIIMDEKNLYLSIGPSFNLNLDPSLKDWLLKRSVQLQIENAYFEVKKDSIISSSPAPEFFDNLGKLYLLDDYTRFSSVRETFIEIVSLAAVRGGGENVRFVVNNAYDPQGLAKFSKLDPLVLMDGFQILNNNELINYNARDIKSIRVINEPYRYGPKLFSGIIAVETIKGDFKPEITDNSITFEIHPIEKQKKYYNPTYSSLYELSRIPDFRVQLLWHPELRIDGPEIISFYTSDVSGPFEISLNGFTDEGEFITVKQFFNVSNN